MNPLPTLVMIPGFLGAPWKLEQLTSPQDFSKRTLRLPDDLDELERLADLVTDRARGQPDAPRPFHGPAPLRAA